MGDGLLDRIDALTNAWDDGWFPQLRDLLIEARNRIAQLESALSYIAEWHSGQTEEAERYHRDGDLDGPCPTPDRRHPSDPCPGHFEDMTVCVECGYGYGFDDAVRYRAWPCPTLDSVRRVLGSLGTDPDAAHTPTVAAALSDVPAPTPSAAHNTGGA